MIDVIQEWGITIIRIIIVTYFYNGIDYRVIFCSSRIRVLSSINKL